MVRCRRRLLFAAVALAAAVPTLRAGAAAPAPTSPGISPPGANDWRCRARWPHPYPVILVHGTYEDMTTSWSLLSPLLAADGYCVFALDYGERATALIEQSARVLAAFVERVLAATRARHVAIVGHSLGAMMPRYYLRFLG